MALLHILNIDTPCKDNPNGAIGPLFGATYECSNKYNIVRYCSSAWFKGACKMSCGICSGKDNINSTIVTKNMERKGNVIAFLTICTLICFIELEYGIRYGAYCDSPIYSTKMHSKTQTENACNKNRISCAMFYYNGGTKKYYLCIGGSTISESTTGSRVYIRRK